MATTAKIIIFYAGYYGQDILGPGKKILPLGRLYSRYAWIGALQLALIPIPNLVSVTLGRANYRPWKFASAILLVNSYLIWHLLGWQSIFQVFKRLGLLGPRCYNVKSRLSLHYRDCCWYCDFCCYRIRIVTNWLD